jgi:hypothetical protein
MTKIKKREKRCEFCGKDSTQYIFATFICNSGECIEKAMKRRGGPGGHLAEKIIKSRAPQR